MELDGRVQGALADCKREIQQRQARVSQTLHRQVQTLPSSPTGPLRRELARHDVAHQSFTCVAASGSVVAAADDATAAIASASTVVVTSAQSAVVAGGC